MKLRQMGNRLYFRCPGCDTTHCVQVAPGEPAWTWNGSFDKPTFHPSVFYEPNLPKYQCHFFVEDGKIRYLMDCHHELRGKTVPMEDLDNAKSD